jgi:hypothetical protein
MESISIYRIMERRRAYFLAMVEVKKEVDTTEIGGIWRVWGLGAI